MTTNIATRLYGRRYVLCRRPPGETPHRGSNRRRWPDANLDYSQEHHRVLPAGELRRVNLNAAGIDVGAERRYVAVPKAATPRWATSGRSGPSPQICVLRSYLRQRARLVTYAAHHIQHMQKALEQMNVKLAHVVSDIAGLTGRAIIRAILARQREPRQLATLRDPRCKADEQTIARSLEGNWRSEHLFELRQALELVEFYQQR
jgi:hypothetical protein